MMHCATSLYSLTATSAQSLSLPDSSETLLAHPWRIHAPSPLLLLPRFFTKSPPPRSTCSSSFQIGIRNRADPLRLPDPVGMYRHQLTAGLALALALVLVLRRVAPISIHLHPASSAVSRPDPFRAKPA